MHRRSIRRTSPVCAAGRRTLTQDRVDHGVPPRPRVYRCPLIVPSSTIPAARMVCADAWVLQSIRAGVREWLDKHVEQR